ncbi:hypothetical protein [Streptomyces sp. VRA16 Mangrove soil]|uniref:hypothetical protein n=1 Tax=Streptomyces sp. VRA16 Mangrove soil TaxID=2817434 RepID=UPI001A9E006D|nr:hypothetical protein [Streptomyces sp. VRA16 Mangrove soil]MBO1337641.1 hypothetical protein [Streptomyces sp. VRA16 Mangrove soil]
MDAREAREARGRAVHEIDATGLPTPEAQDLVLRELRGLADRAVPFTAVLLMPEPEERPTGAPATERIRALKELRPGLTAHCRGLAFVAPAHITAERARAIHSGDKLWGCPTTATQDVAAGRAWARGRMV